MVTKGDFIDDCIAGGFTVSLKDAAGNPVAGEVAVFVVDKAFLDVKPHPSQGTPAFAFAPNYSALFAQSPDIFFHTNAIQCIALIDDAVLAE